MEKKAIAKHIISVVGGAPQFSRYCDKNESSFVHIMTIKDVPEKGVNFYSTIGTSEYTIGLKVNNLPLRVELIFTIDERQEEVANILATSAFCIINSGFKCYPGAIFNDVISSYVKDTDMKHVMFVQPFLWEDSFNELRLNDKIIEWLLAVPISEKECRYAEEHGSEALEQIFEEHQIDIFNLYRKSIL
jgi:hypothetical protein